MKFRQARLQLGLTDIERNAAEARRRARNCFIVIALCILAVGVIEALK